MIINDLDLPLFVEVHMSFHNVEENDDEFIYEIYIEFPKYEKWNIGRIHRIIKALGADPNDAILLDRDAYENDDDDLILTIKIHQEKTKNIPESSD